MHSFCAFNFIYSRQAKLVKIMKLPIISYEYSNMDILVEIPRNIWPDLRDLYKTVWPKGAVAYCVLDTLIANRDLSDTFDFKIYSPEGDILNGMIAISDAFNYYQLLVHPVNDIRKIEEALQKSSIINWNRDITIPSASLEVRACLKRLQEHLKLNINFDHTDAFKHLLDNKKPLYNLSAHPPDTYVAPLKPQHIALVDKTWSYHSESTHLFFEVLMKNEMAYVLYSTKDDTPMAWITVSPQGSLTHLYTLEPYRRLGYAEFITKYATNDLRQNGRTVLAYTVEDNERAQRMFEKLGFDVIGYDRWTFIKRDK